MFRLIIPVIRFRTLVTFALFASVGATASAHPFVPDQANDLFFPATLHQCLVCFSPMGQEFTPALSSLNVVEIDIEVGLETSLRIDIHASTIDGAILGTSQVVTASNFQGIAHFDFPISVTLVPGNLYVLEVVVVSGEECHVGSSGTPEYPGGNQIFSGLPDTDNDLWFREGPLQTVGVENASWAGVKALYTR